MAICLKSTTDMALCFPSFRPWAWFKIGIYWGEDQP